MVETRRLAATLFKRIESGGEDDDQSPGWSCTACTWSATEASLPDDQTVRQAARNHSKMCHEETPSERDKP